VALLGFGVAFVFGAGVQVASAEHYHICCSDIYGSGHALVHGGSTRDGVWHGRSTGNNVLVTRYCEAGSAGAGRKGFDTAFASETCEVQVRDSGYYLDRECNSYGYIDYGTDGGGNRPHSHGSHRICADAADAYP